MVLRGKEVYYYYPSLIYVTVKQEVNYMSFAIKLTKSKGGH